MLAAIIVPFAIAAFDADRHAIWQIGKPDGSPMEFASAPKNFSQIQEDPFFIVGRHSSKVQWPYAQPGPADSWAEMRNHQYEIVFSLAGLKKTGAYELKIRFFDTHSSEPPKLALYANGLRIAAKQLPPGLGDESIFGRSKKGRPTDWTITVPAEKLKNGLNAVAIASVKGSWAIYDSIEFFGPKASRLGELPETIATFEQAPADTLTLSNGKPSHFVKVKISRAGPPARALVQVDSALAKKLTVETGDSTVEVPIAAEEKPVERQFRLLVEKTALRTIDGTSLLTSKYETAASAGLTLAPVRRWTVYLVPHSHVDIGYTDEQETVKKKQWKYLEDAIQFAKETKDYPDGSQFIWNAEVMWPIESYLREGPKDKRSALLNAIKDGSIALDALYGNELTGLCQSEELFELVHDAVRIADWSDASVRTAMISDVPGYSWGLVPALAKNGIRYLSCGPNSGDRIGYTLSAWADKPFWWQGANPNDKVLTWVLGTGYSTNFDLSNRSGAETFIRNYLRRLEEAKYPYNLVQVRFTTGGDNGAPDRRLSDFVKDWNAKYAYPKLVVCSAEKAFTELEKQYGQMIPTYAGDFTPYWEDGAPSTARETALARQAASRMILAETVAALRSIALPQNLVSDAWRNILLFNEHTWGAFNSVNEPDSDFAKKQWLVKKSFADQAEALSRKALDNPLPRGNGLEVYNALSWLRSGMVKLPDDPGDTPIGAPIQTLADGSRIALVGRVPGLGSKRYDAGLPAETQPAAAVPDGTLENAEFKVSFDMATGNLASVLDKRTGKELMDPKQPWGRFVYLLGSNAANAQGNPPMKFVRREIGPVLQSIVFEGEAPGCNKLTREVRLVAGSGAIEVNVTIDKKAVREKEGVHIGFGFNVPNGRVLYGTGYGSARPELDQLAGACKNWYAFERWADISNNDGGVTWVSLDAPLVELGGLTANLPGSQPNPNAYMKKAFPDQTLFSWAMNNHWHTNYKADQDGPVTFRYAIRPHGPFVEADAQRFALEQSIPLYLGYEDSGRKALPSLFSVAPSSVLVTRLRAGNVRGEYLVRLYNCSSKPVECKLSKLPLGLDAYTSDSIGRKGRIIDSAFAMAPHDVVTIVLKVGR